MGTKVIKIKKLFNKFSRHVERCKSAKFVCCTHAAFESWFRVELNPVLWKLGYPRGSIETNYTYHDLGLSNKADLCVKTRQGDIVFELKSFVRGQDSAKKKDYPEQIARLEKLIDSNSGILQVITFTTFTGRSEDSTVGYPEVYIEDYCEELFLKDAPWKRYGPYRLVEEYPLYVVIAAITRR